MQHVRGTRPERRGKQPPEQSQQAIGNQRATFCRRGQRIDTHRVMQRRVDHHHVAVALGRHQRQGVHRQIALRVDQDDGTPGDQIRLDQVQQQSALTRTGRAENMGMAAGITDRDTDRLAGTWRRAGRKHPLSRRVVTDRWWDGFGVSCGQSGQFGLALRPGRERQRFSRRQSQRQPQRHRRIVNGIRSIRYQPHLGATAL